MFKYVESGVEDEIENFGKTVGGRPRNISEMLRVIEIRLAAGRNKFYLQFIFNPWTYHSKPPIVEITSVNCQDMDTDFFSIQQIDADEGRFRITIHDHDDWTAKDWQEDQDPEKFWSVIIDVLEVLKNNGLTFKNLNMKSGAWDLFFPIGVRKHFNKLSEIEKKNNWKLLTEKESSVLKKQAEAKQEAERKKLQAKIELVKFAIERSADLDELEDNISNFDDEFFQVHEELKQLLETKREKLTPSLAPIDFDNPAYTNDTAFVRKPKTKIRRIKED